MNNYKVPNLINLLILISFLFLLQLFKILFKFLLGIEFIGEILIGIIFSLLNLLPLEFELTFQVLGYFGLILLVFQSGLNFNLNLFKLTLKISILTALIGILLPITFTFILFSTSIYYSNNITIYESFIISSALSSTSLGTTLNILSTTLFKGELIKTKLGNILITSALLDDIVSLVLLSIIQSLGNESSSSNISLGWIVGKPLLASIILTTLVPLIIYYIIKPLLKRFKWEEGRIEQINSRILFSIGVVVLSAFLSISYYSGTTVLLGAYLAGVFLSLPSISNQNAFRKSYSHILEVQNYVRLIFLFSTVLKQILTIYIFKIFVPLFFASIGYSIPFLSLWETQIIWKGIVYSLLMLLGKFLAGTSIILFDLFSCQDSVVEVEEIVKEEEEGEEEIINSTRMEKVRRGLDSTSNSFSTSSTLTSTSSSKRFNPLNRTTLIPASLLGTALIARGEIGLIILQITFNNNNNNSTSSSSLGKEGYLIGIWAVLLCTLWGPIGFSFLINRFGKEVLIGKWGKH